jgi:hypothetical protein
MIVLFIGCSASSTPAPPSNGNVNVAATATIQGSGTQEPATPISSPQPTPQPVDPTANIPKVPGLGSENGPELGSPLSVFVKTFGPTTDNIWGIGGNDVSLAVDTTGSKVTYIFISTDDKVTWSKDQTNMIAFCSEFMPLDVATSGSPKQSSEFYSQNFTSSIGDFYMLVNHSGGPGTWSCDMETGSN